MSAGGRLRVAIGSLDLHGYGHADKHRLAAALERELARMAADRGLPPGTLRAIDLAHHRVDVPAGTDAETAGAMAARSLFDALAPTTPHTGKDNTR
jgi:hypothetical protein